MDIPASDAALPYVVSTGIRDVFIGLAVLILFYLSESSKALGAVILCVAIVAISDFVMVRRHGDKKVSLVHLAGAIGTIIYGSWLLSAS